MTTNKVMDALLGVAVGDALGVPYEFKSEALMERYPAKDMIGFGTYNQPEGTWSDDSSLTFCLADSLIEGYDLADIATKFIAWRDKALWTAYNEVFDIGGTTNVAISRLKKIITTQKEEQLKELKNQGDDRENGNGSLMRILPLLFYIKGKPIKEQFDIVFDVSALTHRHIRSAMSCLIYLRMAEHILNGASKKKAYSQMRNEIIEFWKSIDFEPEEQIHFSRLIDKDILEVKREDLRSGGYVIESLEASFWCFLKETDYKSTVLAAVNLGHDTDTTAAIVGGLAGLFYGANNIPVHWVSTIARVNEIKELANELNEKYCV